MIKIKIKRAHQQVEACLGNLTLRAQRRRLRHRVRHPSLFSVAFARKKERKKKQKNKKKRKRAETLRTYHNPLDHTP